MVWFGNVWCVLCICMHICTNHIQCVYANRPGPAQWDDSESGHRTHFSSLSWCQIFASVPAKKSLAPAPPPKSPCLTSWLLEAGGYCNMACMVMSLRLIFANVFLAFWQSCGHFTWLDGKSPPSASIGQSSVLVWYTLFRAVSSELARNY